MRCILLNLAIVTLGIVDIQILWIVPNSREMYVLWLTGLNVMMTITLFVTAMRDNELETLWNQSPEWQVGRSYHIGRDLSGMMACLLGCRGIARWVLPDYLQLIPELGLLYFLVEPFTALADLNRQVREKWRMQKTLADDLLLM